jgi:hypothetical protein
MSANITIALLKDRSIQPNDLLEFTILRAKENVDLKNKFAVINESVGPDLDTEQHNNFFFDMELIEEFPFDEDFILNALSDETDLDDVEIEEVIKNLPEDFFKIYTNFITETNKTEDTQVYTLEGIFSDELLVQITEDRMLVPYY